MAPHESVGGEWVCLIPASRGACGLNECRSGSWDTLHISLLSDPWKQVVSLFIGVEPGIFCVVCFCLCAKEQDSRGVLLNLGVGGAAVRGRILSFH